MALARPARHVHTLLLGTAITLTVAAAPALGASSDGDQDTAFCVVHPEYCADTVIPYEGHYIGHDEPSIAFYSARPGSGNNLAYSLTLPKDPPGGRRPGAVFNSELYETFWFGMAMCDTESAPEAGHTCVPDSDANIFDNPNPAAPDYIGKHPGTAYMELQFYPPGTPFSIDGVHWYVALNIFSISFDQNAGVANNGDCLTRVGIEPFNSAHLTRSGAADTPAGPLSRASGGPNPNSYLAMNSGDAVTVLMHDTPDGFQAVVRDQTTGRSGSMTASIANGFTHVVFDPSAATCTSVPYSFHPMYSTSSEHTRVPWTVHSYNVGLSFEIGHFEVADGNDDFPAGNDSDFDGPSYQFAWPGTLPNFTIDQQFHPQPLRFSSPVFSPPGGQWRNYDRAAFETDLPRIESTCNGSTGVGCSNPPPKAAFYPFYTTGASANGGCVWQFGGANISGSKSTFGGSPKAAYGGLLQLFYPGLSVLSDFRRVLTSNPCSVGSQALPHLSVPPKLSFTRQAVNSTSAPQAVALLNGYPLPVNVTKIVATGDFAVKSTNCGAVLEPHSMCQAQVTFTPQKTGTRTGLLTVTDNATNAPQVVKLSGVGR